MTPPRTSPGSCRRRWPERRDRGLRGTDATEIDAQYVLPVGFGEVLERDDFGAGAGGNTTARDDPGVGPGDVELAEVVHGLLNGLRDLVFVRGSAVIAMTSPPCCSTNFRVCCARPESMSTIQTLAPSVANSAAPDPSRRR